MSLIDRASPRTLVLLCLALAWCLRPHAAWAASCHTELSIITDVDPQHAAAEARRVMDLLASAGDALPDAERGLLEAAFQESDRVRCLTLIQEVLDRHCLIAVSISAEAEVRAQRGPAQAVLPRGAWGVFVVKVDNRSGATSPLTVETESAIREGAPARDRWVECALAPPETPLSGKRLDYYVLRIRTDQTGAREATFICSMGVRPDVDTRAKLLLSVPILFSIQPPAEYRALREAFSQHTHHGPRQGPPLVLVREAFCRSCHAGVQGTDPRPEAVAVERRCLTCHGSGAAARWKGPDESNNRPPRDPQAILALLADADADRGRAVFFRDPVPACFHCHRLQDQGTEIGPDLAGLARRAKPEEALESILRPSARIADGYRTVVVVTQDERIVTGLIRRETARSLVLRDNNGRDVELPREDVRDRTLLDVSLMPENVADALSPRELADLLKFLVQGQEPGK